jgi:hypothetical protein
MKTYTIVLKSGHERIRRLIREANVNSEERKSGPADIYFVAPETIGTLPSNAWTAMVIIPKGTNLKDRQHTMIKRALRKGKAQVVRIVREKDAVKILRAWFVPKTMYGEQK